MTARHQTLRVDQATLTVLSWNICQGGGNRIVRIADAAVSVGADVVVLSEVTARNYRELADALAARGFTEQTHRTHLVTKVNPSPCSWPAGCPLSRPTNPVLPPARAASSVPRSWHGSTPSMCWVSTFRPPTPSPLSFSRKCAKCWTYSRRGRRCCAEMSTRTPTIWPAHSIPAPYRRGRMGGRTGRPRSGRVAPHLLGRNDRVRYRPGVDYPATPLPTQGMSCARRNRRPTGCRKPPENWCGCALGSPSTSHDTRLQRPHSNSARPAAPCRRHNRGVLTRVGNVEVTAEELNSMPRPVGREWNA
jgi:hypothetical protein